MLSGSSQAPIGRVTVNVTATSTGDGAGIDVPRVNPMGVGFGLEVASGEFSVQFSFDGANFFDHPYAVNITDRVPGNFAFPFASYRVVCLDPGSCVLTLMVPGDTDKTVTQVIA